MHSSPDDTTLVPAGPSTQPSDGQEVALSLTWSAHEPERVGELIRPPLGKSTFGRATKQRAPGIQPLTLWQVRPTQQTDTGPLRSPHVSRYQLSFTADEQGLCVSCRGRGTLLVNNKSVSSTLLSPGDRVRVAGLFSLLVCTRPRDWHATQVAPSFTYGRVDPDGMVGESVASWQLRRAILDVGSVTGHVLVHGPSGSGKELVVRAVHRTSPRHSRDLVARNAATLVDTALFGRLCNDPDPSADLPGLLGVAHGSTLFLDEIGEMPHPLQARLLRVMDSGEYQQLGGTRAYQTNTRIIGTTNRLLDALKPEFSARFTHRICVPSLQDRLEDVPLIARELIRQLTHENPQLQEQFLCDGEPQFSEELIDMLLTLPFRTHVREARNLLWHSVRHSRGKHLQAPSILSVYPSPSKSEAVVDRTTGFTRDDVLATLENVGWVREQAWRALGLRNRYQLRRLLNRLDITSPKQS
ncbi:MAG: sigma-54-dependent transcriptional regulator [Nannocystaceae bacterium]